MKAIMTISGKDRPGIIAAVTKCIFQAEGNLEDAHMTILEGEFAMMLLVDAPSNEAYSVMNRKIKRTARNKKLQISMKRIEHVLTRGDRHRKNTEPFVISVFGRDQAGIVYQVSKALSEQGINITDLSSRIAGTPRNALYSLILEIDLPKKKLVYQKVKRMLKVISAKLGVEVAINPLQSAEL